MLAIDDGQAKPRQPGLTRQLSLISTTAIVVGQIIGVGIFLTPAGMARSLGSPALLLLVWGLMALISLAGALCFGGLAARFPEAGGGYVYLRETLGPRVAFLFGWMSLLVTDPGITAILAAGLAEAIGDEWRLSQSAMTSVAVLAVLLTAGVNALGVHWGARLSQALTSWKLAFILFLIVWGFALGRGHWSNFVPFVAQRPGSKPLPGALVGALVAAFFSFAGWWDLSKLTGEAKDPKRTMPRALALGVAIVTVAYVLLTVVFLYLVPSSKITSDRAFARLAGEALFGPAGGMLFASAVAIAVLGSLTSLFMAAPRVYYAMAQDGLFPAAFGRVDPRFGTPIRSIAIQATLAIILVISGTFNQILAYFFFVTVAFLAVTVAGIYRLELRDRRLIRGYPFTPLCFLVPMSVILVLLALESPWRSLLGTAIVILGWPAYRFRADRGEPSVETAAPGWLAPAAETPAGQSSPVIVAPSDEHGVGRETGLQ
jgi:APA family basic amino acid/polyamine antiporter